MNSVSQKMPGRLGLVLIGAMLALWASCLCTAQKPAESSSEMHEMLVTPAGFLAIDTPKGWEQSAGPGLAFFLPKGFDRETSDVWIYINYAPVGPNEEDKDMGSYIQSDIAGFKHQFKNAIVRKEEDLLLSQVKQHATVYSFQSGDAKNSFEQVIYIEDAGRVLILDLTAKNADAFARTLQLFHEFAKSYRGSIQMDSPADKH
jgi:hypothetical protein